MSIVWSRAVNAVKAWWYRRSDAFRAGWVSAWVTFTATVLPAALATIDDLQQWVLVGGDLPDLERLARVAVSAGFGLVAFVLNFLFRRWKPGPTYPTGV